MVSSAELLGDGTKRLELQRTLTLAHLFLVGHSAIYTVQMVSSHWMSMVIPRCAIRIKDIYTVMDAGEIHQAISAWVVA